MLRSPRRRFWRQEEEWKEQEMKRSLTMHVSPAGRSLRALGASAMLFLALTATGLASAPQSPPNVGPTSRVVTLAPLTVIAKISAPFGKPKPAPEVV